MTKEVEKENGYNEEYSTRESLNGKRHKFRRSQKKCWYLLSGVFFLVFVYLLYSPNFTDVDTNLWTNHIATTWKTKSIKPKKILLWNWYWNRADYWFGFGNIPFHEHSCIERNCVTTGNRNEIYTADAIVIHINNITNCDLKNLPTFRKSNQIWVLVNMEPPVNTRCPLRKFNGLFNITMTYRWDSDIVSYYGYSVSTETGSENKPTIKGYYERPYDIMWLVSNCHTISLREKYVQQLQKFINVDIQGKCGTKTCPRNSNCEDRISNYKFYLAFENSLCRYYITEKVFRALEKGTIPIVLGAGEYKSLLPPYSYINVEDFESPEKLAKHLKDVSSNPVLFDRYQTWRKRYKILYYQEPYMFCSLCSYLHIYSKRQTVIRNLDGWFNSTDTCISPQQYYKSFYFELINS